MQALDIGGYKMEFENITFPKGTTFLVTGAAGFIGSNLVNSLLDKGFKVRGLDNFSTGREINVEEFLDNPNYDFIKGDIRDSEVCLQACEGIDYVLHQAALGSVPRSMKEPLIYEDNNIKGTSNMMEAARLSGVKRFVYASSSSVYGDSPELPKIEGKEGNILSTYALTKMTNEQYGKLYTEVYGLECVGLRYFNVFGKRQDPDSQYAAVIPKFIKSILSDEPVEIYGDGEQSRDFTFIENVIQANLKSCLAPSEACGRAYNIAYGESITLNDLYKKIGVLLEREINPIYGPERAGDIKHSLADISNTKKFLSYEPHWDFETGFKLAVDWYKENLIIKQATNS